MFLDRARRAGRTLSLQRINQPPNDASAEIKGFAYAAEMDREIAAQIVGDVRRHVNMSSGSCAVCYTLAGVTDWSHKAGPSCDKFPIEGEDWDVFRNLEIPSGTSCFRCYLPTVSFLFCVRTNGPDDKSQNLRSKVPGAEYHEFKDCTKQHILKPSVFAFWLHATPKIKQFVCENFQVNADEEWKTLESYKAWLVRRRADTFNYLYLYWWLLLYHGHV